MKKALILAYDFPPYNSIGAQRPFAWFSYFKDFGLDPVVVTRHWDRQINGPDDCNLPSINSNVTEEVSDLGRVIRTPFVPTKRDRLIPNTDIPSVIYRKSLSVWQLLTEHFLESSDNKVAIYDGARSYLKEHQVDVIIACGEPFILFSHAARLSREFHTPWVGDYRDGWSTNYRWDQGGPYAWVQHSLQRWIERKVTSTSALLTTAAPDFSRRTAKLTGRKVEAIPVIYNGYFEEKFKGISNVPLKNTFSIAHAGTLYDFQRVETFLTGLNLFVNANPDKKTVVTFYGLNFYPDQIARIRSAAGKATVSFVDKLPHDDMLKELASSHLQLLLATPEKHQIYAKVFDYLATGRPILMVENDKGPLEEMLSKRRNASVCSTAQEVADHLTRIHADVNLQASIPIEDDTFTRRNQTARFAELVLRTIG